MDSKDAYEEKYEKGYGTMYPESHVIRFYEHFLKYEMQIEQRLETRGGGGSIY